MQSHTGNPNKVGQFNSILGISQNLGRFNPILGMLQKTTNSIQEMYVCQHLFVGEHIAN